MSREPRKRRRKRFFRSGHASADIAELLAQVQPKGKCLDLPAGSGVNIEGIRRAGFEPVAADIFPERAEGKGARCLRADFTEPLPFGGGEFAAVLCSEGIEHCPCQLRLIREFARVLRLGGTLLLTTPNVLNFRARLSYLLNGHYSFARAPISRATQLWGEPGADDAYVGHAYLVSYFVLRFMLTLSGFERLRVTSAKYSTSSVLLAPLLYLPVRLATGRLLGEIARKGAPAARSEILSHAMSADMLFGKKLILLADKKGVQ